VIFTTAVDIYTIISIQYNGIMVRYSKEYGDIFNNVFTWGIESALRIILNVAENYRIKKFNKKEFYEDINDRYNNKLTKRQISDIFYELKRNKYIEFDTQDGERSIKLTNKAKIKLIEEIVNKESNDKENRFISFDIPERLHQRRDNFRRAIKRMGFRAIQQSLWVINKNVGEMVEIAAQEYGVEEYVAYIVSKKSNIDEHVEEVLKIEKP